MKRAADELRQLLNYEKLTAIRVLEIPTIEKKDLPTFILCPNFDKATRKVEQTMERYTQKVNDLKQRLQDSHANIESLRAAQRSVDPGRGVFVNRENPEAVARYNNRLQEAKRLGDKIDDAVDKHNDIVARHDEAIAEANEKLEELSQQALVAIDDDIVAVLDKCNKVVERLSGSQNTSDLVAALEICMMELRIFALFEDKIEGNDARKDCRDRITEVNRLFPALCANEHVRNYVTDLFRRNVHVVQKNGEIHAQLGNVLASVDQRELDPLTQSIVAVLGETFDTNFAYEGVIDPAELEAIVVKINGTIKALKAGIVRAKEVYTTTGTIAQAAVSEHQNAETLLASMKANVEGVGDDLLTRGHFACEMIEEAVIDDFYHRDLRPAVTSLRQYLVDAVGEEQVDALVMADEDRHFLAKAENAIKQANLLRLQDERDKIEGHVKRLLGLIATAEQDIQKAGEVPQQNADRLRADLGTKYILSCIPGIGFLFALGILGGVKKFEPAFRSSNQIYRDLGAGLLVKNGKMTTVVMVLGGLLGLGGMAAFFALKLGPSATVNAGVPGVVLLTYGLTVALLSEAGKRLRSYLGISAGAVGGAISAGGGGNPRS